MSRKRKSGGDGGSGAQREGSSRRRGGGRRAGRGPAHSRVDLVLVVALVLGSLALRLALLNAGLFHHDAVRLAQAVERSQEVGRLQPLLLQEPPVAGRYGLVLVNWAFYAVGRGLFGLTSSEPVLLLTGALFGSLATGALYGIARALGLRPATSLAAGVLLSLSPIFFSETVGAKGHGLALCLALTGIYLAIRAAAGGSPAWGLAAGAIIGASGFVRETALLAALPAGLILLVQDTGARRRALPAFVVPVAVGVGGLLLAQWTWITRFISVTDHRGLDLAIMREALGDVAYSITPVGFALLCVGVFFAIRSRPAWGLVLWMLVGFLYAGNLSQYSARFLIEPLAAAALFVAWGLDALLGRWRPVFWLALAALALVPFVRTWNVIAYRHDRIGGKEVGSFLRLRTPRDAVVIAMDDAPFVQYYGRRETLLYPLVESDDPAVVRDELGAFAAQVGNLLETGRRVYLLRTSLAYDRGQLLSRLLNRNFSTVEIGRIESEDYHHKSIRSGIFEQIVYELRIPEHEPGR